ncbi:hypothetical protein NWF32_26895 [Pseudomonas qingdaonensis]|nr:hypothetical protein [Pseudomonas qingdaonensis]
MDFSILAFLAQDGLTTGAIYALVALALVLVFSVTRTILVCQGDFVTYSALTLATLQLGLMPGTVGCCWAARWPPAHWTAPTPHGAVNGAGCRACWRAT